MNKFSPKVKWIILSLTYIRLFANTILCFTSILIEKQGEETGMNFEEEDGPFCTF